MKFYYFIPMVISLVIFMSSMDAQQMPRLQVATTNPHYLETVKGKPFFWLGDTGWLLFSKLSREEAIQYLNDRAEKGFNVIQVMVLHELDVTNFYGDSALIDKDISKLNTTKGRALYLPNAYDYWDHIDFIISQAEKRGIYLALVPIWGDIVNKGVISTPQAREYITWLVKRYRSHSNIIWLNGGDTRGDQFPEIWQTIGQVLRRHDSRHLIVFHPFGRTSSSWWFHQEDWLDVNEFQSGHQRYDQDDSELGYGEDNWKYIRDDYSKQPIKPTLDGEPSYEGIPQGLHDGNQPYWTADDVRRYAYWSVFGGGCGFTYGHNAIMQMHKSGDMNPAFSVREYWTEALDAPGATQMPFLKNLLLSRSYFDRIPDQSLLAGPEGEHYNYQAATRGRDYAMIYVYNGRTISVHMGKIIGGKVKAEWFNPRTSETTGIGTFENTGTREFTPPGAQVNGNDWVLILDSMK